MVQTLPDTPRGHLLGLGHAQGTAPVTAVLGVLWHGVRDALLMAWEVWWALAFGFLISAIVQAWVPRERIERALSGDGVTPIAKATGLGAASSSCSYAAIAIA